MHKMQKIWNFMIMKKWELKKTVRWTINKMKSKKIAQQEWSRRMQGTFSFFTFSSIVQIDPFCDGHTKNKYKIDELKKNTFDDWQSLAAGSC